QRRPRQCPHAGDDRGGLHDALLHPPLLRRRSGRARLRGSAHRRRGRGCRGRAAPGGGAPPPGRAHASRAGPLPRGSPQRAPRRRDAGARHEPMARRLIARDIVADGIRIHVVEAGEGPALMLLHGLTATHFTWEHTIPAFADRWRVIAPDLPGHGRSEKPDAPCTIDFARRSLRLERLAHEDYPRFARAVSRSLRGALAAGRQPLERLWQPTLLVWGRHDRLVALSGSRRLLRAVPHARLAVLDGCGHLPMVEQPARFNHVVADFLRVVEASPLPGAG